MRSEARIRLINRFLSTANKAIWEFPADCGRDVTNYFRYSRITPDQFFSISDKFSDADIIHAIDCIETDQWDQSEFIMSTER